jgi:hypothetical protein
VRVFNPNRGFPIPFSRELDFIDRPSDVEVEAGINLVSVGDLSYTTLKESFRLPFV